MEIIKYSYQFKFEDGQEKHFTLSVDLSTLTLMRESEEKKPDWTKLEKFKCSHCPLDPQKEIFCPVAVNIKDIISSFSKIPSFERADLVVQVNERKYVKENTAVLDGVSGIIGILMVTSGCPIIGKLKPMVRFHLPFGSLEETEYRVISMYLMSQYFRFKAGKTTDFDLVGLKKIYEDIQIMNHNVAAKIADLEDKDTSLNTIVALNNFAEFVTFSLDEEKLEALEVLFKDYLKD